MGARKGSLEHLNALLAAADDNRKSLSLSGMPSLIAASRLTYYVVTRFAHRPLWNCRSII